MNKIFNLQHILIIIFFFTFISETESRPRVLKCAGDCGVIDESSKYSAVARLCYGSGNGSDVTFKPIYLETSIELRPVVEVIVKKKQKTGKNLKKICLYAMGLIMEEKGKL